MADLPLLIEPDELEKVLGQPGILVVDCGAPQMHGFSCGKSCTSTLAASSQPDDRPPIRADGAAAVSAGN